MMIRRLLKKFLKKSKCVSVLYLHGAIGVSSGPTRRGELSLKAIKSNIDKAFGKKENVAVLLSINSPGGSPVQSEIISNYIKQKSIQNNTPIYSCVEDVAASGGYWLACTSDKIFASRNSIVGSIGVISAGFGFVDTIKKLGVERRVITQGLNKSTYDPFEPVKEKDKKKIQGIQKDIHDEFIQKVKSSRGDRLKGDDDELFNGDFWTGKEAINLGLVDESIDMYQFIEREFGPKIRICCVTENKGFFSKLFKLHIAEDLVDSFFSKVKNEIIKSRYEL